MQLRTRTYSHNAWFNFVIIFTILYSFIILLIIAYRFFSTFPDEAYGISARLLYGSWGMYAILQLTYVLIVFGDNSLEPLDDLMFGFALFLKTTNIIGLLYVLQKEYNILQAEFLESSVLKDLGDLAAGLHHDLLHPIAMIDTDLNILKAERANDNAVKKYVESISKPLKMINAAASFVELVRLDPEKITQEFKKTSVKTPVEVAISLFKKRFEKNNLRIIYKTDGIPSLHILANENLLADAFFNITRNASEASASNVEIQIWRSANTVGNIDFLFFNDGENIAPEATTNCFKAGWSSKEQTVEKGNIGMGLYMCSKIVKIHRGKIEIFNLNESTHKDHQ